MEANSDKIAPPLSLLTVRYHYWYYADWPLRRVLILCLPESPTRPPQPPLLRRTQCLTRHVTLHPIPTLYAP